MSEITLDKLEERATMHALVSVLDLLAQVLENGGVATREGIGRMLADNVARNREKLDPDGPCFDRAVLQLHILDFAAQRLVKPKEAPAAEPSPTTRPALRVVEGSRSEPTRCA